MAYSIKTDTIIEGGLVIKGDLEFNGQLVGAIPPPDISDDANNQVSQHSDGLFVPDMSAKISTASGNVLTQDSTGLFVPTPAQTTYTAGDGIDITANVISTVISTEDGNVLVNNNGLFVPASEVTISEQPGNILTKETDGLFVPTPASYTAGDAISIEGTNINVDISASANNIISVNNDGLYAAPTPINISPDSGNQITLQSNGLYVPEGTDTTYTATDGVKITGTEISAEISTTANNALTVDENGLFVPVSPGATYTAGTGLELTDTEFSAKISTTSGNTLTTDENGLFVPTPVDTTYTAGDGMELTGTSFSSKISTTAGNTLSIDENGLFVPAGADAIMGLPPVEEEVDLGTIAPEDFISYVQSQVADNTIPDRVFKRHYTTTFGGLNMNAGITYYPVGDKGHYIYAYGPALMSPELVGTQMYWIPANGTADDAISVLNTQSVIDYATHTDTSMTGNGTSNNPLKVHISAAHGNSLVIDSSGGLYAEPFTQYPVEFERQDTDNGQAFIDEYENLTGIGTSAYGLVKTTKSINWVYEFAHEGFYQAQMVSQYVENKGTYISVIGPSVAGATTYEDAKFFSSTLWIPYGTGNIAAMAYNHLQLPTVSASTAYTAGSGLELTDTEFSAKISTTANNALSIDENGLFVPTADVGEYTAGNGLQLTGTEFSTKISTVQGNMISVTTDGLYAALQNGIDTVVDGGQIEASAFLPFLMTERSTQDVPEEAKTTRYVTSLKGMTQTAAITVYPVGNIGKYVVAYGPHSTDPAIIGTYSYWIPLEGEPVTVYEALSEAPGFFMTNESLTGNSTEDDPLQVAISATAGNTLTLESDGLFVPAGGSAYTAGAGLNLADSEFSAKVSTTANNALTIDANGLFVPTAEVGEYTAGNGLELTDTEFSAKISTTAGNIITASADGLYAAQTDTTYTAGSGLVLDENEFSAKISTTSGNTLTTDENGLFVPASESKLQDLTLITDSDVMLPANLQAAIEAFITSGVTVPTTKRWTNIDYSASGAIQPGSASVTIIPTAGGMYVVQSGDISYQGEFSNTTTWFENNFQTIIPVSNDNGRSIKTTGNDLSGDGGSTPLSVRVAETAGNTLVSTDAGLFVPAGGGSSVGKLPGNITTENTGVTYTRAQYAARVTEILGSIESLPDNFTGNVQVYTMLDANSTSRDVRISLLPADDGIWLVADSLDWIDNLTTNAWRTRIYAISKGQTEGNIIQDTVVPAAGGGSGSVNTDGVSITGDGSTTDLAVQISSRAGNALQTINATGELGLFVSEDGTLPAIEVLISGGEITPEDLFTKINTIYDNVVAETVPTSTWYTQTVNGKVSGANFTVFPFISKGGTAIDSAYYYVDGITNDGSTTSRTVKTIFVSPDPDLEGGIIITNIDVPLDPEGYVGPNSIVSGTTVTPTEFAALVETAKQNTTRPTDYQVTQYYMTVNSVATRPSITVFPGREKNNAYGHESGHYLYVDGVIDDAGTKLSAMYWINASEPVTIFEAKVPASGGGGSTTFPIVPVTFPEGNISASDFSNAVNEAIEPTAMPTVVSQQYWTQSAPSGSADARITTWPFNDGTGAYVFADGFIGDDPYVRRTVYASIGLNSGEVYSTIIYDNTQEVNVFTPDDVTLAGRGTTTDPLHVNLSTNANNALINDGTGLYVPKSEPVMVRRKNEVIYRNMNVAVTSTPQNLINTLKALTPDAGTLDQFLNTTSNQLNVYNYPESMFFKLNITGSWGSGSSNMSFGIDFSNTVLNNMNQARTPNVTNDTMSFNTFISVDLDGNIATNGTPIMIYANGDTFTITSVMLIVEQRVPENLTIQPV